MYYQRLFRKLRGLRPMQCIIIFSILVAAGVMVYTGYYALSEVSAEAQGKKAIAAYAASVKADQAKIDALAAQQDQIDTTATVPGTAAAVQPTTSSAPQTVAPASQSGKKTYSYTDGLSGQTTTYTEGCVTTRPGYPDVDCDGRAGAASMPTPTVPTTPTHLLDVRPGSNAYNDACRSIHAASAYFDISDARGGLPITFHFEFDGASPYISSQTDLVSAHDYTLTTHNEPTAPYLQGFDSWYDNTTIWTMATPLSRNFRIHVTSPVDMTSDWKSLYFNASTFDTGC